MGFMRTFKLGACVAIAGWGLCALAQPACAQVSPSEISNPHLKAAQSTYFSQIRSLYKIINEAKFPFTFALGRYVGLNPNQEAESDARGIEFTYFENRMLLKISGNYNAAYNAKLLTPNERASRTFTDVVAPALLLTSRTMPADMECDAIGFEISYHVRKVTQNFDYEGKEILVVVFNRADAFTFSGAASDSQQQEILNRSDIFLDGKPFGLALGQKEPLDVETLARSDQAGPDSTAAPAASVGAHPTNSPLVNPGLLPPEWKPPRSSETAVPPGQNTTTPQPIADPMSAARPAPGDTLPAATQADADRLQSQSQTQLDAFAKVGIEKYHFVDYAPPSFVIYRNQVVLQITLRNTIRFSPDTSSIYKRAAQSFDLFLAGQLKDILDRAPSEATFGGYDITILNQLGADSHSSSEAIEFICPREALRQFIEADITNQQLIDRSVVLVNGVRIALNLQVVE